MRKLILTVLLCLVAVKVNAKPHSEGRYDRGDDEGGWRYYNEDGTIWELLIGRYRLGIKVEDYK